METFFHEGVAWRIPASTLEAPLSRTPLPPPFRGDQARLTKVRGSFVRVVGVRESNFIDGLRQTANPAVGLRCSIAPAASRVADVRFNVHQRESKDEVLLNSFSLPSISI